MAFVTQTVQQLFDSALAFIESKINQDTPEADVAYNKVLSGLLSMFLSQVLKFASDRAKEALTISASIAGLRIIGQGRGITEKVAISAVITFDVPALNGTTIDTTVIYVGDSNGVRYQPDAPVTAGVSNIATITGTALTPGVVGNLANGLTLKADREVSGAEATGTVTGTVTTGANAEEVEAYRQRLLDDERTEGGGSNSADYRRWAQLTPGVERAFPYTGNPPYLQSMIGTQNPGERSIFIKADSTIDPDGVAPQSLLDSAEEYIKTNQNTQQGNEVLGGDIDATRSVESIFNTTFFVIVFGLDVSVDLEAQAKADIEQALKTYFRSVLQFIQDLDFVEDKNDTVSIGTVNGVVVDAAKKSGGTITTIAFNTGAGNLNTYSPGVGELLKLADIGGVSYV